MNTVSLRQQLASLAPTSRKRAPEGFVKAARFVRHALLEGRERARLALEKDRRGTVCAQNLCVLMDETVQAIYAHATEELFPPADGASSEPIAVMAVGGYGRGTLAPFSDVDLLFLTPQNPSKWGESIVEAMLYILWDAGLKVGYAIRSLDDCVRLGLSDMTIRTSMLEARFLCGDTALAAQLDTRFDSEIAPGTEAEFVAAKLNERETRHLRTGGSRYMVEPNVKEGKGGLRDLNTLFWISKYVYRVRNISDLVEKGLFTTQELRRFRACESMLWAVRCHLHFIANRAEERLTFDLQPQIAQLLSYKPHPGAKDVERFMKHYFLAAKDVGDFTAIICAALEAEHAKDRPILAALDDTQHTVCELLPADSDFVIANERLSVRSHDAFTKDPVNLIRFFHAAAKMNVALHPDALRLITQSLKLVTQQLRENAEANALFLEILCSKTAPEKLLRSMNETGLLGRFIPDFGRIIALMQFNMYHHYTVDEHLLRSVGILADLDAGRLGHEHPLITDIIPELEHRKALYVAVFLHDIAKGRPEDHSTAGARVARRLCPRLGLSPSDTETVAWLIQHHLLMSIIAQSRDLSDPRTITDFINIVQTPERLKLLLILTVADIKAVGPGVWNGWKGQLLRMLYWEAEVVLAGGHSALDRSERVKAAQDNLAYALKDWPEHEVKAHVERHFPPYWLKVDLVRQVSHAQFMRKSAREKRAIATHWTSDAFRSVTEITVLAPDNLRLLSQLAGACAAAGANIMDAYINTTTDGMALDTIFINRTFEHDDDEARFAEKLCANLELTIAGKNGFHDAVNQRIAQRQKRIRPFTVEPHAMVTNSWSDRHTVIEVSGLDRPGLLHDLTAEISALNLNIASAHIATFGERAVDVFYVTDAHGEKITDTALHSDIREKLLDAFKQQKRLGSVKK